MAIREEPTSKNHDRPVLNRTRWNVTLITILAILTVFLFPSLQGPYSVVCGPATVFQAARAASVAYASILQGTLHTVEAPVPSHMVVVARLNLSEAVSLPTVMLQGSASLRC